MYAERGETEMLGTLVSDIQTGVVDYGHTKKSGKKKPAKDN